MTMCTHALCMCRDEVQSTVVRCSKTRWPSKILGALGATVWRDTYYQQLSLLEGQLKLNAIKLEPDD